MIGKTISHYKILEKIGGGGMGIVYKAQDLKLDRYVALKFLPPHLSTSEEDKQRFIHEAKAASSLDHNNICNIYEIDETKPASGEPGDSQLFISMAYYEGNTLDSRIKEKPLSIDIAVDIAIQIAQGLAKAHEKEIIHRDIKPANIMITEDGVVKIVDFGLAKLSKYTRLTREGASVGTIAYMSPEQTRGEEVDHRSDIWSLGVMLYEMVAGELPFKGDYDQAIVYAILNEEPKALNKLIDKIPREFADIIIRCLKKSQEERYDNVREFQNDLNRLNDGEEIQSIDPSILFKKIIKSQFSIPVIFLLIIMVLVVIWIYRLRSKAEWAEYKALPEIQRLTEDRDWIAAYNLAKQVEGLISEEVMNNKVWPLVSRFVLIKSDPEGARVFRKFYTDLKAEWEYLGQTPIDSIRFPKGFSRLKFEKPDYHSLSAAVFSGEMYNLQFKLDTINAIPNNMVRIPGGIYRPYIPGLYNSDTIKIGDFLIDKYEVTNREFKLFIDNGGYKNQKYWKHPFVMKGEKIPWDKAMTYFKDKTDRTGPATWEFGDYPDGEDDYPVTGVSWFEAAAYAEYKGKSLPTIFHWHIAAKPTRVSEYIIPLSNFGNKGVSPVGSRQAMDPWGTFDMAGNVQEWCLNHTETETEKFILGGAWSDFHYMFHDPNASSAFNRSSKNGFRCVKYLPDNRPPANSLINFTSHSRHYLTEKPVTDKIFQIYKRMFTYDKTELNATLDSIEIASDWYKEKIFFDAAYGNERMFAYLFVPKDFPQPYQTIVYFPGANAIHESSSKNIGRKLIWQIVKSGRALIYPIYQGTYERSPGFNHDYPVYSNSHREHVICLYKDLARSIDYLETRNEIDVNRLAYVGVSWGASMGALFPAIENRIKVNILWAGGFPHEKAFPEVELFNFTPRITIPTLMLNGRYDFIFPVELSQIPLYNLLGTSKDNKRHILFNSGHVIPENKGIQVVLDWLDKYLGPVRQ